MGASCALQIRLFDGSAIRKTFSSQNTLGKEVRAWIDAEQKLWQPYHFKQIQAPSKSISAGEEQQSLQELGLLPNATLVLVPVKKYNSAYESGSGVTGVVTGAASASVGLVEGAVGLLGSGLGWGARALGSVLSGTSNDASGTSTTAAAGGSEPQRYSSQYKEGNQFYNGNNTNFEPRREDDNGDRKND